MTRKTWITRAQCDRGHFLAGVYRDESGILQVTSLSRQFVDGEWRQSSETYQLDASRVNAWCRCPGAVYNFYGVELLEAVANGREKVRVSFLPKGAPKVS